MAEDFERVVVSAPMSFAGSTQRAILWLWTDKHPAVRWGIGIWLIPILLSVWWAYIAAWYFIFGIFLVPYRLLRRGSRKRKREDLKHQQMMAELRSSSGKDHPLKQCPRCAEDVHSEANLCKHCGSEI
jgi:hypothetical protein